MQKVCLANVSPTKNMPLIRKGCEYIRNTGVEFAVTNEERSRNKKSNKKLFHVTLTWIQSLFMKTE